ncbi:DUF4064 domain-containing protein [Terribacillus sp. 7520-G]|uniref:DUF4064 domain-containing protein n=1 Tax=Terribacillus TaxID=459532 RepID=UPI000BA74579|nr:DUF4064 domain-containing protein [Terribacillus sp. 7520-G]PAD40295.1 hypothetical protein CHH53_02000 [Terribacillus sp. 7520-G]
MKTPKILTILSLFLLIIMFFGSLLFTLTLPQNQSMIQAVTAFLEDDPKYQKTLADGETPSSSLEEMAAGTMSSLQVLFVIPTAYIGIIAIIVFISLLIIPKRPGSAALTLYSAAILSLATIIVPVLLFIAGSMMRKRAA